MADYHDTEWGLPVHDDQRLFELLTLEGAQAGLSWRTVLQRRDGYRDSFAGFDIETVAGFDEADIENLLTNRAIIRNRLKVQSTVSNARAALEVIDQDGSLDALLWSFVGGRPIRNAFKSVDEMPSATDEAAAMSKALKKRGFKFVGPTICYALMQAAGLVNDHLVTCFRYAEVGERTD
jgi:DNA-3-methyladenine glycosylase I